MEDWQFSAPDFLWEPDWSLSDWEAVGKDMQYIFSMLPKNDSTQIGDDIDD